MNRLYKTTMALILAVVMILSMEFMTDSMLGENSKVFAGNGRKELIEKRTANSKHYLNPDGTITAEVSAVPMHYKSGKEYKTIDTTIQKQKSGEFEYVSQYNDFNAYFNGHKASKDSTVVRFEMQNSEGITRSVDYKLMGTKPYKNAKVSKNRIVYKDIMKNVDLEYIVQPSRLKENIIINKPIDDFSFSFLLDIDGAKTKKHQDGSIEFIDMKTGETLWYIKPPYAEDSSTSNKNHIFGKNITFNVSYDVEEVVIDRINYTRVTLKLNDKEFLKNAVYPITIDPTTMITGSSGRTVTRSFAQDDYIFGYAFPGYPHGTYDEEYIVYLGFDLSGIPAGTTINSANLTIVPAGKLGSANEGSFRVSRLTSSFYNTTWDNRPSEAASNQSSIYTYGTQVKIWDITGMMQEVKQNNLPFYGISLRAYPTHGYVFWYDYDNYPTLTVTYNNNTAPTVAAVTPSNNQVFSTKDTAFVPKIQVTDSNNNTLTCTYYIDSEATPRDTKSVSNTISSQQVNFNTLNISTLSNGNHTMRFVVNDGSLTSQASVNFSVDKTSPTIGTVTTAATDTALTITGSATDTSGLDPNPYRYTVGTQTSSWTSSTTYTKNSLLPNTANTILFEARDNAGNISSESKSIQTKAQIPVINVDKFTAQSLDLTITDSNPPGTEYQIMSGAQYINKDGILTSAPAWFVPTSKKMTIYGLSDNTAYSFKVKARNAAKEETSFSEMTNGTTLSNPPNNLQVLKEQTRIVLKWTAIPSALSYDVEADGQIVPNGSGTTYTHDNLTPDTHHTYRVRVRNAGGIGSWSQNVEANTLPNPPVVPVNIHVVAGIQDINLSWDTVVGASSYEIEVDGTIVDNGELTTFHHLGLTPKSVHNYRIRAVNAGGASQWSALIIAKTLPNPPLAPQNIKAVEEREIITLLWNTAIDAETYDIEINGRVVGNVRESRFVDDGISPDTERVYRIRGRNEGGIGEWSIALTARTLPLPPTIPDNLTTIATSNEITLSWDASFRAERYEVEIDGVTIQSVEGIGYMHRTLPSSSRHSYRIRAINRGGFSQWSRSIQATTLEDVQNSFTNVVVIVTNRTITLSWDAVGNGVGYEVEVDGNIVDNGTSTIFKHTQLLPKSQHSYKVRPKSGNEIGSWCTDLTLSTLPDPPEAPKNLSAESDYTEIQISWEAVVGAEAYDIEIDGETVQTVTENSYVHRELIPGTQHSYRIRAKNLGGVTAWSNALTKSTQTPTFTINGEVDQHYYLILTAAGIQDFTGITFKLIYDPTELEVVDLYDKTEQDELVENGRIPGTNLSVTYKPGEIIFTVEKSITPGKTWSGEINTIIFKSKANGPIYVDYNIE